MKIRKLNRLKNYDYSNAGWYFITICTKDHKNYFCKVVNEKIILNEVGEAAEKIWLNIPDHFPFAALDEYIIMPNHIHGIIIIDYNFKIVGNENYRSLHRTNLSNIIKGFKIGVTKWCKINNPINIKWQHSFYDRIIRNENELFNIRKYIKQNPLKWELERDRDIVNLDL